MMHGYTYIKLPLIIDNNRTNSDATVTTRVEEGCVFFEVSFENEETLENQVHNTT